MTCNLSTCTLFPSNQAYFILLGLYTLYGGIILPYEDIPAGFRWVYYTNPGRWPLLTSCCPRSSASLCAVLGIIVLYTSRNLKPL